MLGSRTYDVRVKGAIQKELVCEHCQAEFSYVMSREAIGSATTGVLDSGKSVAVERAQRMANATLRRMLEQEQDAVACPGCGFYQSFMIPLVRKATNRWMVLVGAFFLIIAANCGVLWASCRFSNDPTVVANARQYGDAALLMGNMGLGIILLRKALALRVSPNIGDPDERKRTTKAVLIPRGHDSNHPLAHDANQGSQ